MVSTRSATAVTSEGFTLLRKRSSEGAPTLTPLPKAERRPRAESDSVVYTRHLRLGGWVEVMSEELPPKLARALPRVSVAVAAPPAGAGAAAPPRRRVSLVVERRRRTTVSVDASALALAALVALAALLPTAAALAPSASVAKFRAATRHLSAEHGATLDDALAFAQRAHAGQRRKSGEPFVVHPIETACILAEMRLDADTVVAGLLHDTVEDTDATLDDICARFGGDVANIVRGVTDEAFAGSSKAEADERNRARLVRAMAAEWRVALVKLADRAHNMRTLGAMPAPKRAAKAAETLELFVPLARGLGVASLERELAALSAEHLAPSAPGAALGALARASCPAIVSELLADDAELRALAPGGAAADAPPPAWVSRHAQRWDAHCAAHAAALPAADRRARRAADAVENAREHVHAVYAAALAFAFAATPAHAAPPAIASGEHAAQTVLDELARFLQSAFGGGAA